VSELSKSERRGISHFSEEMIQECLLIIQSGGIEDCFEIIPRLGVLRDSRFAEPLLTLLQHREVKRKEFAAYSMGAIGDKQFMPALQKAFFDSQKTKGFGSEDLQIAIIEAIGAIGDDAAVEFFLPLLKGPEQGRGNRKVSRWIVESLGSIAQQGGDRSLEALLELTFHEDPELRAQALSELSVAYWHRPNEIADSTLDRICELAQDRNKMVAESALAALQSLADVGCKRAENLFSQ
jgi:HEAT repeat protein